MNSKQKNKSIKSGFYSRLEWPEIGGCLKQSNLTVEIFDIILDEKNRSFAHKVK